MPATIEHIERVLAYLNDNGETETLKHYQIKPETLERYKRRKNFYETKQPKVLLLDIETSRIIFGGWSTGKQYVNHEQIIKDWFIFGWACKWLFESKTESEFVISEEALKRDDSRICKKLWAFIERADIIITHNGDHFDTPKINWRFLINKITPPSPFQSIDTYKVSRKTFGPSSHALTFLGKMLLRKEKIRTDYQLWIDCENGNQSKIDFMKEYCKGDVGLLEDVYLELRPWIKSHPNMAIYQESIEPSCPNCGSANIDECGHYATIVNRYIAFRCRDCGAICRSRKTDIPLKCKAGILSPTAR